MHGRHIQTCKCWFAYTRQGGQDLGTHQKGQGLVQSDNRQAHKDPEERPILYSRSNKAFLTRKSMKIETVLKPREALTESLTLEVVQHCTGTKAQ